MNLLFCDICHESIPEPALLEGSAEKRGVRTICEACLSAMSSPGAGVEADSQPAKQDANAQEPARRRRRAAIANLGMSGMGVGLGSLAVLIAVLTLLVLQQDLSETEGRMAAVEGKTEERIKDVNRHLHGIEQRVEARLRDAAEDLLREGELATGARRAPTTKAPRDAERDGDVDALAELVRHLDHQVQILSRRLFDMDEGLRSELDGHKPSAPRLDQGDLLRAIEQLRDPDPRARLAGLFTVEAFEDPKLTEYIAPLLKDSEAWIRLASVRATQRLGAVDACPDLIAALDDNDTRVRDAAVAGLRGITGEAFGYDARSSLRERRVAQGRWSDWWRDNWKSLRYGMDHADEEQ